MRPLLHSTLLRTSRLPRRLSPATACSDCLRAARPVIKTSRRPFYNSAAAVQSDQGNEASLLDPLDTFARRHIGPSSSDAEHMLRSLDPPPESLDAFVKEVLPGNILSSKDIDINGQAFNHRSEGYTETELIARLRKIASGK